VKELVKMGLFLFFGKGVGEYDASQSFKASNVRQRVLAKRLQADRSERYGA